MINGVWGVLLLLSLIYGIASGKGGAIAGAAMDGAMDGIGVCLTMLGGYALWMGMMNWMQLCGLSDKIAGILRPAIGFLFPGVPKKSSAERAISMNLAANMLGVGNAATPFGLEAMREMRKLNDLNEVGLTATDAMCMFLIINASSVQLIPGTVILLRAAAGSVNPSAVVLPGLIATACSTAAGIIAAKLMAGRWH